MRSCLVLILALFSIAARGADYVITVSVDGMGSSYLQSLLRAGKLPAIAYIAAHGAGTTNARADCDITTTLPNHTAMLTSRPILGPGGHNWTNNSDHVTRMTLHANKSAYLASAFDVAHDNGRRTGLWSTKSKFALFDISYNEMHGAPDTTGTDNGRDKLDVFTQSESASELTRMFLAQMTTNPCHYAFVHLGDADLAGHLQGWGSDLYLDTLEEMDVCIGRIISLMTNHPALKNHSALIVTADHGGYEIDHRDSTNPLSYTIPFYTWGVGVATGDLYTLNSGVRASPGTTRPDHAARPQPVRNSDAGNLALHLLGLGPIPGSVINASQDLRTAPPPLPDTK
jgi:predicted AlkP superfamily pyrophosphatase or phosphodiesterase